MCVLRKRLRVGKKGKCYGWGKEGRIKDRENGEGIMMGKGLR
jgi:hypothetical protein